MNNKNFQLIIGTITTILSIGTFFNPNSQTHALQIQSPETSSIAYNSTNPLKEFLTTKIYQHQLENKNVITLYFQGMPFLTFLPNKNQNSLQRAENLAYQLEKLNQNQADGNQITVNWQNSSRSYIIKHKNELIVNMDSKVILPDTTNNLELDALQATNRLRRLFGSTVVLKEVAGRPTSQAVNKKSTQQNARLTSNKKTKVKLVSNQRENPITRGVKRILRGYKGFASWYGPGFHGRRTANGERFNQNAFTAAHRYLPFGTRVKVTNVNNGKSVVVRINDRGPFTGGRIIDLSRGAAGVIGLLGSGTAPVRVQVLN